LRKNMTQSEIILWEQIKNKKIWERFLRQNPVYVFTENSWLDRYIIPDFICHNKKLILEIDWNIHNLKNIHKLDLHKEELLKKLWFKILRIQNEEIKNNLKNTIAKIKKEF
jgi:very-short-patch-repair endonuclease